MKSINNEWNKVITSFVEKIGGEKAEKQGTDMYFVNGELIDLTASGTEPWQITKNILRQL